MTESSKNSISVKLDVTFREDHTPCFDGYDTPHSALIETNEKYKTLSFSDQMLVSALVLNQLCPIDEPDVVSVSQPRDFIYVYEWNPVVQDHICMVIDAKTGSIIFNERFKNLFEDFIMSDVNDVQNLTAFLYKNGEILEGDRILMHRHRDRPTDPTV